MQRRLRLRRREDFDHLKQVGRTRSHRMMVLSAAPNAQAQNRYGFIVSKQLGNAVVRNRARRLLRESVRLLHPQVQPGYDVVFIARRPIVGQPFAVVLRIVSDLFRQAGLLKSEES